MEENPLFDDTRQITQRDLAWLREAQQVLTPEALTLLRQTQQIITPDMLVKLKKADERETAARFFFWIVGGLITVIGFPTLARWIIRFFEFMGTDR